MISVNSGGAPEAALQDDWAAELTTAAYFVALRHCTTSNWLDLQLELWRALSARVAKRGQEVLGWRKRGAMAFPTDDFLAELAYLAYRVALPYGCRRSFLDLELELYQTFRAMRASVGA